MCSLIKCFLVFIAFAGPVQRIQSERAVLRLREEAGGHAHGTEQQWREGLRSAAAGLVPRVYRRAACRAERTRAVREPAAAAGAGCVAQHARRAASARVHADAHERVRRLHRLEPAAALAAQPEAAAPQECAQVLQSWCARPSVV